MSDVELHLLRSIEQACLGHDARDLPVGVAEAVRTLSIYRQETSHRARPSGEEKDSVTFRTGLANYPTHVAITAAPAAREEGWGEAGPQWAGEEVFCAYCDGTGWVEGGTVLRAVCPECIGTGKSTPARPDTRSGEDLHSSPCGLGFQGTAGSQGDPLASAAAGDPGAVLSADAVATSLSWLHWMDGDMAKRKQCADAITASHEALRAERDEALLDKSEMAEQARACNKSHSETVDMLHASRSRVERLEGVLREIITGACCHRESPECTNGDGCACCHADIATARAALAEGGGEEGE